MHSETQRLSIAIYYANLHIIPSPLRSILLTYYLLIVFLSQNPTDPFTPSVPSDLSDRPTCLTKTAKIFAKIFAYSQNTLYLCIVKPINSFINIIYYETNTNNQTLA